MKKLLLAVLSVFILVATAATLKKNNRSYLAHFASAFQVADSLQQKQDSFTIIGDSLFIDTLALSLKSIPKAQHLYTVAKTTVGKWAKLFVVLKIEESGADGKNSFYAKNFNNLTGMRCVGKGRKTTSTECGAGGYAKFPHWFACVQDFKHYMDVMDARFLAKYGRAAKNEQEMINFMHGSYNVYSVWKRDVEWLLNHFNYK